MNIRLKTIKTLKRNGYILDRHGSKHDIYINKNTGQMITVKRHNFDENTMKYILNEAGIKS